MAQEKKEGIFSRLDTRQKVIGGVFVVIVLIILWQVMGLFGGGTTTPATPTPAPQAKQGTPGTMTKTPPVATANPTAVTPPAVQAQPQPVQTAPLTVDNTLLETEKKSQQKYIDTLNQLQLLKIQRDIAETNQAIAVAKLATVTAENAVSNLLTKPAAPIIPPSAYSNMLVNPTQQGTLSTQFPPGKQSLPTRGEETAPTTTTTGKPTEAPSNPPPSPPEAQYSVISVSMQMGQWKAVIGFQGKLYSVSVGDVLPADKSVIVSINRDAVILEKDGKKKKISIISSI